MNKKLNGEPEFKSMEEKPHTAQKKVFVSGCYDMLHSGHVAFFKSAARFGDLYVGLGSDKTIEELKHRKTVYSERERLYMVKAIRYVKDAFINPGSGLMDFVETLEAVKPDIFVVNSDGSSESKRKLCEEKGIEYIVLDRIPDDGLVARSTTSLRQSKSRIPYRVDIAGTWIDQPYVSEHGPGWAITASIEPTVEFMERGGMATSTRNAAKKIWPYELPEGDEEIVARLLFCFENDPEKKKGHISGAQDSIGICMSGLNRHYYNGNYWPEKIESCQDEDILSWLEAHIALYPMFPRRPGCSVVEDKNITREKVKDLTKAAERCWNAIMEKNLGDFAAAFTDSFNAQIAMFPKMMQPGVAEHIDQWNDKALAWKMLGAGGGGYLALVFETIPDNPSLIPIKIRRR